MKQLNGKRPRITQPARPQVHVPARLVQAIYLHLIRNFSRRTGPLLLGIHGAPGVGKTFGVAAVLHGHGVRIIRLSSGEMESAEAGEPARRVREAYLAAGRLRDGKNTVPAALVLDDADVGLGDWGENVQYTVNRQTVCGELMHLADHPEEVDGRLVRRVPIILTGNNLGRLYPPLVREGRMTLQEWTLLPAERIRVLSGIFAELTPADVQKVAASFHAEPIAFFADLRRRLEDEQLLAALEGRNAREALWQAARNGRPPAGAIEVTLERVLETGRTLRESRVMADHLRPLDPETLAAEFLLSGPDAS
jgi:hypothetical protein